MVIADYARDLPCSIFELPEVNESALPYADLFVARMMKTVYAGFERAVSLHVEGLQRDKLTRGLSADIFLDAIGERGLAQRDAALVVVELDVVSEERFEFLQVAFVVGIKQRRIQRGDGPVEFGLIGDLIERQGVLREQRREEQRKTEGR
jgi:hypothetical protein